MIQITHISYIRHKFVWVTKYQTNWFVCEMTNGHWPSFLAKKNKFFFQINTFSSCWEPSCTNVQIVFLNKIKRKRFATRGKSSTKTIRIPRYLQYSARTCKSWSEHTDGAQRPYLKLRRLFLDQNNCRAGCQITLSLFIPDGGLLPAGMLESNAGLTSSIQYLPVKWFTSSGCSRRVSIDKHSSNAPKSVSVPSRIPLYIE